MYTIHIPYKQRTKLEHTSANECVHKHRKTNRSVNNPLQLLISDRHTTKTAIGGELGRHILVFTKLLSRIYSTVNITNAIIFHPAQTDGSFHLKKHKKEG
jgi:hypothetical protein